MPVTNNNFALLEQTLVQHLLDNLPSGIISSQVKLPNAPFSTPNAQPFLRVDVSDDILEDIDATGCYVVTSGTMRVDVFYPSGTGSNASNVAANSIKQAFSVQQIYDVGIPSVMVRSIGEQGDWWVNQVVIKYTYQGYFAGV